MLLSPPGPQRGLSIAQIAGQGLIQEIARHLANFHRQESGTYVWVGILTVFTGGDKMLRSLFTMGTLTQEPGFNVNSST